MSTGHQLKLFKLLKSNRAAKVAVQKDETQNRANGLSLDCKTTNTGDSATTASGTPNKSAPTGTKVENVLRLFVGGKNMNRFEAERHHDHCLHSTVSTLQNEHDIKIDSVFESVPCVRGTKRVRCKRYWLLKTPENISKAEALLKFWSRT